MRILSLNGLRTPKKYKKEKVLLFKEDLMKKIKKFAAICLATICCFAVGACLTACGGKGDNSVSSEQPTYTAYEFTVIGADGKPATGVSIQLCDISNATVCYMPVAVDANGKAIYTPMGFPGEGVYEIHILKGSEQVEFDGPTQTTNEYGAITLTLK